MPVLRDRDGLLLLLVTVYLKPFIRSILNDHLAVVRSHRVQYVKEEFSTNLPTFREVRGQKSHQLFILRVVLI